MGSSLPLVGTQSLVPVVVVAEVLESLPVEVQVVVAPVVPVDLVVQTWVVPKEVAQLEAAESEAETEGCGV